MNDLKAKLKAFAFLLLLSACSAQKIKSLNEVYAWKDVEYGFPSEFDHQHALNNGLMAALTGTPIDVAVQYTSRNTRRVFQTIPRFSEGIPYTLATVSSKVGKNGPVIYPYPNYAIHKANNSECTGIVSAFRVVIDDCEQMWIIDSGMTGTVQTCPPQLLKFDLKTDSLVQRYQFPKNLYMNTSLFINLAVDILDPPPRGSCQKAMVYVADVNKPGLLVYNSVLNDAWRIENKLMAPVEAFGTHNVAGGSFYLMDGIFAVNLSPRNKHGRENERYLYFHALASETENAVPLRLLNNQTIWRGNTNSLPGAFITLGKRGVQAALQAIDSKGNLYANTEDPLTVFAWNINKFPYTPKYFNIVANNQTQLQFASAMKVVRNPYGKEELWMSTCRFQKVATGTLDPNEDNFRILACNTDDLLQNNECSRTQAELMSYGYEDDSSLWYWN